ncbi:MAG: 4-(cytidine 5'-diphospho)-2-C-methyl-D-erythritol kinase [Endomicrobium sp.]|jgi:4-diphosphocytidyl-2-C-methyl-D-erythritol kinase|nr:4-(cytidine 5'-diphospho)-2-C-methyl-D-erythritol kinase [Endomicrobium sp.]
MRITLKAPAKINLFLEIAGKRDDGYHDLESIMQTVSLYDELTFEPAGEISLSLCVGRHSKCAANSPQSLDVPLDDRNIIIKAAKAMREKYNIKSGVKITLQKNIPAGAGLGGGSSDAAATLKALNELWQINAPKSELEKIASKLGADVAFFLTGGAALCEGIGDIITPLGVGAFAPLMVSSKAVQDANASNTSGQSGACAPLNTKKGAFAPAAPDVKLVLVNPNFGVSTPSVYKKVKLPFTKRHKIDKIKNLILDGFFDKKSAQETMFNRLEDYVLDDYKEIAEIKSALKSLNCASLMSGSGATVFGIYEPQDKEKIEAELKKHIWSFWFAQTI